MEPDKVAFTLQAVELVQSIAPTQVETGEARGLILMKSKRWFEAQQQFEEILSRTEKRVMVLTKLIECSETLGDKIKQEVYRAQLATISRPTVAPR